MKKLLLLLFVACCGNAFCQIKMELTPQGFASFQIPKPQVPADKLIEGVRNWVATYNEKNEYGYDITDVSDSGMTIDAYKRNAFYYYNKGELFQHRIRYRIKLDFLQQNIRCKFSVTEVYAKKNLIELTVADFFTSDGKLKDDYEECKPSLERTASSIVNSFADFMARYN